MNKLRVENLSKNFGGVQALLDVSLSVVPGERHAIIGPNGAGKSTLFKVISGELRPTRGRVFLDGQDVTARPVFERANLGLGQTFQRNNLFMGLTTLENVQLSVQHQARVGHRWHRAVQSYAVVMEAAEATLARVGLLPQRDIQVSELAYGQQRALEIALALATQPSVLLMDEPTAGMSPAETAEMIRLIQDLPDALTLMIVEHDMDVIFSLADRITVLHYGEVIRGGTPVEVRQDRRVQEIYLGVG